MIKEMEQYFKTFLGDEEDYTPAEYQRKIQEHIDEFNDAGQIAQIGYTEIDLIDGIGWVDIMYNKADKTVAFNIDMEDWGHILKHYKTTVQVTSVGKISEQGFLNGYSYTDLCSLLYSDDYTIAEIMTMKEI